MRHSVSVIVPTFRERDSLPSLIAEVDRVRKAHNLELEMIISDDDSRDGTKEYLHDADMPWIRLLNRTSNHGLSPAVVDGMQIARHNNIVVMDADLSHPPSKIIDMILALRNGHDFVLGSRYVRGSSTDESWGLLRWINSLGATLLARPLTHVRDPMSGFFAIKKETLAKAPYLNPVGYKIGLELIVKCQCDNIAEIPIHFSNRQHGESKLTLKQQFLYLQHLRRLYIFKYAEASHLSQFIAVGVSGVFVNLSTLTVLKSLSVPTEMAVAGGIGVSMITNFLLNQRFTFSYARKENKWKQFTGFIAACSTGAVLNWVVTMYLVSYYALFTQTPQWAALVGILAGTGLNYGINRALVFRKA